MAYEARAHGLRPWMRTAPWLEGPCPAASGQARQIVIPQTATFIPFPVTPMIWARTILWMLKLATFA